MGVLIDLTGKRFERLNVLGVFGKDKYYNVLWLCKCDCGKYLKTKRYALTSGGTKSCGCYSRFKSEPRTHGDCNSKEHSTWSNIKQRCYNKKNHGYKYYGGRGISVCDRWIHSYENFLEDVGRAPSQDYTLERIENNGNYEPLNCKWATRLDQVNNRRNNINIEYKGETHTLSEWSNIVGKSYACLKHRYHHDWSTEDLLNKPVYKNH